MIRAPIYYYIESCWMFLTVISNIKIIKKKLNDIEILRLISLGPQLRS